MSWLKVDVLNAAQIKKIASERARILEVKSPEEVSRRRLKCAVYEQTFC